MYFPPPILPLFWQSLPATFRWYLLMDLLPCMFLFYFMLIFWCIFQFWQLRCTASNNTILKGTDRATTALQFVSVCTSLFFFYFEVTGCPCQTLLHYCGISLDEEDEIKARQVLGCPPRQKSRKPLGCQSKLPVFSQRKERQIRSVCFMFQAFPSIWRDENEMILLMTFGPRKLGKNISDTSMPGTPSSQGSAMELSLRQILQAHHEPTEANRYHWMVEAIFLQDE